jgi:hypothetical protein
MWLSFLLHSTLVAPSQARRFLRRTQAGQNSSLGLCAFCYQLTAAFRCAGSVMWFPFYPTLLLAFESGNVIGLRAMKLLAGGRDSSGEANLMISEKVQAMFEASANLMAGGTVSSVVDRYREHVAENAKRLSL